MGNFLENAWNGLTGGEKTTTSTTVEKPAAEGSTNWGMVIGGVVLGIAVVIVLVIVFRKPKTEKKTE